MEMVQTKPPQCCFSSIWSHPDTFTLTFSCLCFSALLFCSPPPFFFFTASVFPQGHCSVFQLKHGCSAD